ncbi:MAG: glycoside hydrolase family 2, partial [Blautia sp.]|nr:glycoside hydrolase family 2 [Blautia sp.]
MVYHGTLSLDADAQGKRVWLEFEGVYQNAFVYVNHAYAGKCAYGYSNFYLDITRFVKADQDNEVKVIVKDGVPSGRWYTGGGIYRDVNVMIADPTHLSPDGVFVYTQSAEEDLARICVQMEVANDLCVQRSVTLKCQILDPADNEVAAGQMPVTLSEAEKGTYRMALFIRNPSLWSDETPSLYRYSVQVLEGDTLLDEECGSFGIRLLQLDPVHGLRVNGKTVKLRGGCIHHDNGIIGTKEFPFAARERVRVLKEAGFNALRSSHYPMSRHLLKACDELGMFVMDE